MLLFKIGNVHKEELTKIPEIFRKYPPPSVLPRVTVREVVQEKLQETNQGISHMKSASELKTFTNTEPLRLPIVETYP